MRPQVWQGDPQPSFVGMQVTGAAARQHPEDRMACSSRLTGCGVRFLLPEDSHSPEEALTAFTGHGVEVKARGSVPTDAADTGHVPLELAGWVRKGCASSHGLHVWERTESQVIYFVKLSQLYKKQIRCK